MPNFFCITINHKLQQCEIIDIATENEYDPDYQSLDINDENYFSIMQALGEIEAKQPKISVRNGNTFYRLKPIDYYFVTYKMNDIDKPASAMPFMQGHRQPTPFAQKVSENLYHLADQKEEIVADIEDGKLYFSIINATKDELPKHHNVLPLLDFSPAESRKMRAEFKKILQSRLYKNIFDGIKLLIFSEKEYLIMLSSPLLLFTLFTCVTAQNTPPSQPNSRTINLFGDTR